jgi:hypothetical protein
MNPTKTPGSQKRASMRWTKKNKEALNLSLNPGTKDIWKGFQEATKDGRSMGLTVFILKLRAFLSSRAIKSGTTETRLPNRPRAVLRPKKHTWM